MQCRSIYENFGGKIFMVLNIRNVKTGKDERDTEIDR